MSFCPSPGLEWLEVMLTTPPHKRGLASGQYTQNTPSPTPSPASTLQLAPHSRSGLGTEPETMANGPQQAKERP